MRKSLQSRSPDSTLSSSNSRLLPDISLQEISMINAISTEKAVLYEKYRLPYASEAVDDLLGRIGQARVIADIGAGTGQLARLFADTSIIWATAVPIAMPVPPSRHVQAGAAPRPGSGAQSLERRACRLHLKSEPPSWYR